MNPWDIELTIVTGRGFAVSEQRALARDVERGLRRRLRRGAYVLEADLAGLPEGALGLLRIRAFAATAERDPVFSHWSAVLLHGLPFLVTRTGLVDVTDETRTRPLEGARLHRSPLKDEEIELVQGLRCTSMLR